MTNNLSDWVRDFVTLRPVCNPVFLRVGWIAYVAFEIIEFLVLLFGTFQNYSNATFGFSFLTWLTFLFPVIWVIIRISLVRIFIEMAARVLAPGDAELAPR
jgi:hypothetical protein